MSITYHVVHKVSVTGLDYSFFVGVLVGIVSTAFVFLKVPFLTKTLHPFRQS